ncbi:MAG: aldehyde ferredoxin oxidoreductase family protein [Syntrophobacteraceae bacterium]
MFGYHGKVLRVDLSNRRVRVQDLDDSTLEKYVGGAGLCARTVYEETGQDTDPLGPDNVFAAFTGPYTATRVPSAGRHHIMALSPQTGILGESNVGGSWAVHLKKAGYDGLIVTGRSEEPVYLWINDKGVEIRDAKPIWGRDSYEAADWLKAETTARSTVAVIGQAGEKLARIAGIPHIGQLVRAAARTGLGAVWGSKNLKAVVVYGDKKNPLAAPDALRNDINSCLDHIRKVTETFGKFGTSGGVENYEKIGNFPVRNWKGSRWEGAPKISGPTMHDTILSGRKGCLMCPIVCGRHVKVTEGPYAPLDCAGPEYETMGTMGGECLVDDLSAIAKANDLCNRYGLDTISTGATIAFAMEAFEKGLITAGDTDGIELTWGNAEALVEMVHKMGRREGIGFLMGEGSKKMAEALGRNAVEFAVHVKGLEPSAHDLRRFFSQALSYATAARGPCHNASWSHPYELALTMPEIGVTEPQDPYQVEGKAEFTAKFQDFQTMGDCLIICRFTQIGKAVTFTNQLNWLNLITGREWDGAEFMKAGERIFTLKRMVNVRRGISRKDDTLPPRFLTKNRSGEGLTNQLPPIGRLVSDYYEHRQWSEEGIPEPEKLRSLGLEPL